MICRMVHIAKINNTMILIILIYGRIGFLCYQLNVLYVRNQSITSYGYYFVQEKKFKFVSIVVQRYRGTEPV